MDAAYTVVRLLGRGGFGRVYEAVQQHTGQRIALKVLAPGADARTLERFRDEARILSMIRDRAVVRADAPVRLADGWAVVMDLAPGTSASRILQEHGPFPPPAAIELIAEVARALDHVYTQPGPEGPLRVLHRDLKPSNLQVSESGEVRMLDFGNARAEFAAREAQTTRHIGGTPGYIAPERLAGLEGPEGDVYSLGVVLYELVTRHRPDRRGPRAETTIPTVTVRTAVAVDAHGPGVPGDDSDPVLQLASQMTATSPLERPSPRDVLSVCRTLLRSLDGPGLADFSELAVPASMPVLGDDAVVGTVLHCSS